MPQLNNFAIKMLKQTLAQFLFDTIDNNKSILFPKEMSENSSVVEENIKFLSRTTLAQMEYGNMDENTFTIKNKNTGTSIIFDNRDQTRGEMRGEILRDYLNEQKIINENKTLLEVIQYAIRTQIHSDLISMLKNTFCSSAFSPNSVFGTDTKPEHFDFFVAVLIAKTNNNIKTQNIDPMLAPNVVLGAVEKGGEFSDKLFKGIDIQANYSATASFLNQMDTLFSRAHELKATDPSAAKAALELYEVLNQQKNNLIEGKTQGREFAEKCSEAITKAQNSDLKNTRSTIKYILSEISKAMNVITMGLIPKFEAPLIYKTQQIKQTLQAIKPEKESKEEDKPKFSH